MSGSNTIREYWTDWDDEAETNDLLWRARIGLDLTTVSSAVEEIFEGPEGDVHVTKVAIMGQGPRRCTLSVPFDDFMLQWKMAKGQ